MPNNFSRLRTEDQQIIGSRMMLCIKKEKDL